MSADVKSLTQDRERAEIIAAARAIEDFEVPGNEPGRFECIDAHDRELMAAIELLTGEMGEDDFAYTGSGLLVSRFGRWLVWRTENGFWQLADHGSRDDAEQALRRVEDRGEEGER